MQKWQEPGITSYPAASLTVMSPIFVSTSGPEDCRHEEEAAAVHRPLQVLTQLTKPLLCVFCPGVSRTHQPGTKGGAGGETVSKRRGGLGAGVFTASAEAVIFFSFSNFVNNSMFMINFPFPLEAAVARWALWESGL